MGILFISHSSADNDAAIKVRGWLKENGWSDVFLDLDPERGLAPGHSWQHELKAAGERCSGVLVLLSPAWITSRWCQTEFLVADQLGKKIFPLFVAPTPFDDLPLELKAKFQIADISAPEKEAEGFERLAIGLKRAGLDPKSFEWPPPGDPQRSIYRGLKALEQQDAAIFFGRDALVTRGLDALRRMRDGSPERMLVILGASGAGKSSFLRAGLLARLKRDEENFLVLPVIRPERAALSGTCGLAASLACAPANLERPEDVVALFAKARAARMARLERARAGGQETHFARPPTIVLAIDQAEELFAAENMEAALSLDLIAGALAAETNAIAVLTIRSDAFAKLQAEPRLATVPRLPFDLSPLPIPAFKEVIEGPARLAHPPLAIEPGLTEQLLSDLAAEDALPLLAFTLERLTLGHRGAATLTLAEYSDELGGIGGAIMAAVDAAFAAARKDPALPHSHGQLEQLARATFIPALVQLDDADAEPRRRVERLDRLPESTRALVRHLVDQRLLVADTQLIDGKRCETVEVAHEAILRQWPALKAWIADERDALRALDGVRAAAGEWQKHHQAGDATAGQSWLTHRGARLAEAESLLARPGFGAALGAAELAYLSACRNTESDERLREERRIVRTRRLQRRIGVLIAVVAVIVLLAGAGVAEILAGFAARNSAALATLAGKQAQAGDYDSAARYAMASIAAAGWPLAHADTSEAMAELRGIALESAALAVLRGHADGVLAAAFSPDGRNVVTASYDNTARVWDAHTGAQLRVLRGHKSGLMSAAFSPDGRSVVTASEDGTARVWDTRTGRQTSILRGHGTYVDCAVFSPDGRQVLTASGDRTARIWDAASGRQIVILRGHSDRVWSARFSADGQYIVTASTDGARIWQAATGRQLRNMNGDFEDAEFSPDGSRIVTPSADKTARIWNAVTGAQVVVFKGHDDFVESAAFSSDGRRVVTSSWDSTARIWDVATGAQLTVLRGHESALESAAFSPDDARIVTTSHDGTARIWNAAVMIPVLRGHEGPLPGASFSPDGRRVVTASLDHTARVWDVATALSLLVLRGHTSVVVTASFSPDGMRIVTTSTDGTARIWNASSGAQMTVLRGHTAGLWSAAFSPDGRRIVTSSQDRTARIWDARTGAVLAVLRGHDGSLRTAVFSPDGRRVLTTAWDNSARLWDAVTGRQLAVLRLAQIRNAAFSPNGLHIITASLDGTARIWDATTLAPLSALRARGGGLYDAQFSGDGRRIVTASDDRTARLWDSDAGNELATLRGHYEAVRTAVFSPDGKRVLTASMDATARIWNVSGIVRSDRGELLRNICAGTLANGLSFFSSADLRAAPELDPRLDTDACHPPGFWARLGAIFSAAF